MEDGKDKEYDRRRQNSLSVANTLLRVLVDALMRMTVPGTQVSSKANLARPVESSLESLLKL